MSRGGQDPVIVALAGVAGALGGILATIVVLLPDVERRVWRVTGAAETTLVVFAIVTTAAGAFIGRRFMADALDAYPRDALRTGGAALTAAGIVVALAAYAQPFAATAALHVLAGALLGAISAPLWRVVAAARRRGSVVALLVAAVVGGAVLAVAGPVVLMALARFAGNRRWAFHRPLTLSGVRAAALVAPGFGLWAAVRLGRVGTLLGAAPAASAPPHDWAVRRTDGLLEVTGLNVFYDQLEVLFDVDLHVDAGETVALLGTNGAGKSTLLRSLFGLKPPTAGRVWFDDRDVTGRRAEDLLADGMVLVPGESGVFPSLTVRENLAVAGYRSADRGRAREGVERTLDVFPSLSARLDLRAGNLSAGEQQMLALARVWITRPRLVGVDELTRGLAPPMVAVLVAQLRALQSEGIAMLVVDQSVSVALDVASRAYFLDRGRVAFAGAVSELVGRDDLLRPVFLAGTR